MTVIVVTGAASGIGRATAELLASRGTLVVGIDRNSIRLQTSNQVGIVNGVQGDVRDAGTYRKVGDIVADAGRLTGWVNCAAQLPEPALIGDQTVDALREILDVNLFGTVLGTQKAISIFMAQQTGGAIVNVSSIHSRYAYEGWSAYDISKAAVESLTRAVAVEYGPFGIRANAVAPALVAVERWDEQQRERGQSKADEYVREIVARYPLRRLCQPVEVARAIEFLLSESSSYVNGETVIVDGGFSVRGEG